MAATRPSAARTPGWINPAQKGYTPAGEASSSSMLRPANEGGVLMKRKVKGDVAAVSMACEELACTTRRFTAPCTSAL